MVGERERLVAELGRPQRGVQRAAQLRERLEALRQRYRRDTPLPVFYQVWDRPLLGSRPGHPMSCGGAAKPPMHRQQVGAVEAQGQMPMPRGGTCPKPERAIHMHPCVMRTCGRHNLFEGVERAGVHVAGLEDDDRRTRSLLQRGPQRVREEPPLIVRGHRLGCAEAEVAQVLTAAVAQVIAQPLGQVADPPAHLIEILLADCHRGTVGGDKNYDVRRNVFVGPRDDFGAVIGTPSISIET